MNTFFQRLLKNRSHKHAIDYIAEANSGISAVALLPQLYELLRGGTTRGLSSLSFFLIMLNSVIWLIYGIHRKTPPLIISSTFNATISLGILIMIFLT